MSLGFQPGLTQSGLYNQTRLLDSQKLEILDFGRRGIVLCSQNPTTDLGLCFRIINLQQKAGFLMTRLILT